MAANVETMFSVREKPWHKLGTIVQDAPTSLDALHLAGLDWRVIQKPVCVDGKVVSNYMANVRDSDNSVLGIVSDRYDIVQNKDAFDFTDSLIGGDVRYETAGSLRNGKTIWLLAKLPEAKVLDDEVEQYVCFANSHDGKGAIRVFCTPVRVVCNNTLNLALSTAKRCWSFKHMGNIEAKLSEAKRTLELANEYVLELDKEADMMSNITVSDTQIMTLAKNLFPTTADMSDRQIKSAEYNIGSFLACMDAPDIKKFKNTQWGVVNGLSDFVSHTDPLRNTNTFAERRFEQVVSGHPVFDKGIELLRAM